MALYTPMNGWDGSVGVLRQGGTQPFLDASEIYGITWEENYNPERRKQLGTRSPGYLAGRYEANGSATGYFITGNMAREIYGQGGTTTSLRDHAARGMKEFNIFIDFHTYPIEVTADHGSAATTWTGTHSYALNDIVHPVTPNGHYYKATTAGTSGGSEPTWPTNGTTVSGGGTLVWTDQGLVVAQVQLIGYVLVGCLLDTDSFELQEGQYVEKPLRFQIKNIIEKYYGDVDGDIASFLA